jgi:biotin synthase
MPHDAEKSLRDELVRRLDGRDEALFAEADEARSRYCGEEIHLRGIIEFSNHCRCDCTYCGIASTNKKIRRYRMSADEIVRAARKGADLGAKTIVLQSGEDLHYDAEMMCDIIRRIKSECDVAVTLAIGERPASEYRAMHEAGADRYLLKHETANPRIYAALHPGDNLDRHIQCLRDLKAIGFQIGSGCMIGLPGQTTADLADDILLCRELEVEMAGVGPFVAHDETPLAGEPSGTAEMTLRMVALLRLVLKDAHIPATTALATIDPAARRRALECGANVIMPNITPAKYRRDYNIYPGKAGTLETPEESVASVRKIAESLGRPISTGYGHSLKRR